LRATRFENHSRRRHALAAIAKTSQLSDHLARGHLLRFFAVGWPAFLVPNAFVDLPDQVMELVGDRADRLCVPEARDEPAIDDREDRAFVRLVRCRSSR
jgi:hypothetical protein